MLRTGICLAQAIRQTQIRTLTSGKDLPIIRATDAKRKDLDDLLEAATPKVPVAVSTDETMDIGGVPLEHQEIRVARIFRPAREATQTPWNNTKMWRIELDNRQRWENPLMGWSSSGDPLSNIGMALKFASKEDAIAFCEKNRWTYEVDQVHEREIKPKNYGMNFAWNRKSRMSLALAPPNVRQGAPEGTATIQKLLDENSQLIARIKELQTSGKPEEALPHQQLLHRNLVFLAKAADQTLLPQLVPENPVPTPENVVPPPQQQLPPQMQQQPPPQMQQQPPPQMHQPPMGMPPQHQMGGMPMHYQYPPQGMHPHGYPGQNPYDPQQQMPPQGGPPMGYMPPR